MIPWTLLDATVVPGDGGEMRLYRRGDEYSIRIGPYELMNSRVHASEDALAELVCPRLGAHPRVLIGGLGMGFTLNAVLRRVDAKAEVIVAELVPAVVQWHRGPLRGVSHDALDDARVRIREQDVAQVMRDGQYDAILLDVDNGPAGLTSKHNDRLYTVRGLRAAFDALQPKGILAVWSGGPDDAFVKRLKQTGFHVEEVGVRARGTKGARYVIWVATVPAARP
jgi:spermidine synthase